MTRWAWILVAAAGCAPARPERLRSPKPIPHPVVEEEPVARQSPPTLLPRPDVDLSVLVPDFHDELRWPLTPMNHPVMEPKFPIAQVFAQPGIGWLELCGSGAMNRYGKEKEMLSYLRGWCKAVDGDTDAACSNLAPLIHSTTPRLEAAVRNDLANILAQDHAEKAEHYIRVHALRDIELLDLLAANFVEVGTADDAIAINLDAIASDDHASPASLCLRDTKHIVLTDNKQSLLLKEIEKFATAPKNPDPTCVREYAKLKCWALQSCGAYMKEIGGGLFDEDIVHGLRTWDYRKTENEWFALADTAMLELTTPHARLLISDDKLAEIAIGAMYNGLHVNDFCYPAQRAAINRAEPTLRPHVNGELARRLDVIVAKCQ